MANPHSVPISLIHSLLEGPRHAGVDLQEVLRRAGLPADLLYPDSVAQEADADVARLKLDETGLLLRALWGEMGDEASGFLSQPLKLGVFSMMCHAIISSGNLRRGLLRSARFIHLLTDDLSLELQETGDEAKWIIHYRNPHFLDESFFVTSLFVIWIRLSCWMINQPMILERIQFRFPRPAFEDEYSLMFPCRHYFSQPFNQVVFNRRLLSLPVQQDEESLAKFLHNAPESLLTQFRSDNSMTAQIKRMLLHRHGMQTELENMGFEAVSDALHMTTHTLRRRLKEEGNSYQEIKDSLRRDKAIALLDRPELPLQDIAIQLGFSESAAFNRAFKKWTGSTPGAYRELGK